MEDIAFLSDKANIASKPEITNFLKVEIDKIKDGKKVSIQKLDKTNLPTDAGSAVTVESNQNQENNATGLESNIVDNENNTKSMVVQMTREPDPNIDDNLPSTVTLLTTPEGSKCYVVGTAHFSIQSQNDVSKIIRAVQPHCIMTELCPDRVHVLTLDEDTILENAKNLTLSNIMTILQQNGTYKGLFYILMLSMSANLTKVLGLAPGGEFRIALSEAKKIKDCHFLLGDRPIKTTINRALRALSWWQIIKLTFGMLCDSKSISLEDVEELKSRASMEQMMSKLAKTYPELQEVFIKERDIVLTYTLQLACTPKPGPNGELIPQRVVGIVGLGHTYGIAENWGKVTQADVLPVIRIPPPTLSSKIIHYAIKTTTIGAVMYTGYKVIPMTASMVSYVNSLVTGLVKVSASPKVW